MKGTLLIGVVVYLAYTAHAAAPLPFYRRASTTGATLPVQSSSVIHGAALQSSFDSSYLLNITLGGQPFTCVVDTGSSDLWVIQDSNNPLATVNKTEVIASVEYGDGTSVSGPVEFAELVVGGHTVPSQAFINPNKTLRVDGLLGRGINCLFGLSFDSNSDINDRIVQVFGNTTIGQTPLTNIFDQNPTLPGNFDITLQRSVDLEHTVDGLLLIAEHSYDHGDITKQPILPTIDNRTWTVEVDAVHVNGIPLDFRRSAVSSSKNSTKLGGLLDSGTSGLIVPDEMVSEILANFPNSFLFRDNEAGQDAYAVDCLSSVNMSITMGGIEYHIHPLDLSAVSQKALVIDGKDENITYCEGLILPGSKSCGSDCDLVIGDVFLKNTVTSFNFGSRAPFTSGHFAQLLPLTNQSEAWSDFLATRTASLRLLPRAPSMEELKPLLQNTTNSSYAPPAASSSSAAPSNSDHTSANNSSGHAVASGGVARLESTGSGSADEDSQLVSLVKRYGPAVIGLLAGNILIGVILAAIGVAACLRRQGAKSRNISPSYAPIRFKEANTSSGVDVTYQD